MHVYARAFLPGDGLHRIDVGGMPKNFRLKIYFQSAGVRYLDVSHGNTIAGRLGVDTSEPEASSISDEELQVAAQKAQTIGKEMRISSDDNTLVLTDLFKVPFTETDPPTSPPVGTDKAYTGPTDLYRLLDDLFYDASKLLLRTQGNPDNNSNFSKCTSIYRFIMACSATSIAAASLYTGSQTLLQRLELPHRYPSTDASSRMRLTVPSLSPSHYIKQFEAKMTSADMLKKDIAALDPSPLRVALDNQARTDKEREQLVTTLLGAISKTVETFVDTSAQDKSDAAYAMENLGKANKTAQDATAEVKKAQEGFEKGIKEYKDEQKAQLTREIWKAVGETAFSVGIAVASKSYFPSPPARRRYRGAVALTNYSLQQHAAPVHPSRLATLAKS